MAETRTYIEQRIGKLSQLGGITPFEYAEGKARGVSALRVRTATGLEFWVMPGRGMDIGESFFLGKALSWQSPTGPTHPAYYSRLGLDWLGSFHGGLLCFCGLSHAGAPSEDAGQQLGLHGPISNTPAEHVTWSEEWQGDDCIFTIIGKVRETSVFGHNLLLTRKIVTSLNSAKIEVEDTVENQGIQDSTFMVLYHLNFGYPMLTGNSRIYATATHSEGATPFADEKLSTWKELEEPQAGIGERAYFHAMKAGSDGWVNVLLVSDDTKKDWAVNVRYDQSTLPEFVQWKMMGTNHYVLGLEPANCRSLGRAKERERGTLQSLAVGEKKVLRVQLNVLSTREDVAAAIKATEV